MAGTPETNKPDFRNGFPIRDLGDGRMIFGQADGEELVLARLGNEVFAIAAHCTHYGGPLAEGLVVGDTVRCPWHHACVSLRSGEASRPPALSALAVWQVEREGDRIFVRRKSEQAKETRASARQVGDVPRKIVIVGGGAAGFAAAEMLRREGFAGTISMISDDAAPPVDRPNLSKDYLAGQAPEDWGPLGPDDFYAEAGS